MKKGLLVEKFSSRFLHQELALPEKFFEGKRFLSRKYFNFLLSFFEFEQLLCLYTKFFNQVSQDTDSSAERKKMGKLTLKKMFFLEVFLGIWAEKTWNFRKTLSHNSQNRSLRLQMNIFRSLTGSKSFFVSFPSMNGIIGFPVKMFSQGCQRRISRVQRNILRKWWWR